MADTDTEAGTKPRAARKGTSVGKHADAKAQRRAAGNWARAEYVRSRGHRSFQRQAQLCERFYLGAGEQWTPEDKFALQETGRKWIEDNQIMVMVNTAIGYQIANRMDIAVRPRGYGADDTSAKVMGKTLKYLADDTSLHWRETQVFGDGMIMGRGYYDVRMSFERNLMGEVSVSTPDPIDVMPDPDASAYDPEEWADVTVDRYYTLSHIEQLFGKAARRAMELYGAQDATGRYLQDAGVERSSFGNEGVNELGFMSEIADAGESVLYHVVDRQYRVYEMTQCAVYPTGDVRPIPDATPAQVEAYVQHGAMIVKRMQRRVRWLVSTSTVTLFDDYSPYPWFTIVPFFPFFRRGRTRGMVDNAITQQEALNKGLSQFNHILNTVANSGFTVEENSLSNMTIEEFKQNAAKNGLVIEYKQGSAKPEKIQPSQIPSGLAEYIAQVRGSLISATGMDQALTSAGPMNEMSGVAYQARQYAAQQKLAVPLDNLARTRHMVAQRYIDLVQLFFDTPRLLRIVETDAYGNEQSVELNVNQPVETPDGAIDYINDLTLGEYDLVISEQPMAITFDNSQFEQVKSLAVDFGYPVPPSFAVRYSSLADKAELGKSIESGMQAQPDPLAEARAALANAQAERTNVETVAKRIEAIYGATQAGAQIATIPQVASIADEVLQSSGFEDQNAAPIIPQEQVGAGLALAAPEQPTIAGDPGDPNGPAPENTNPLTPANPGTGLNAGIESQGVE